MVSRINQIVKDWKAPEWIFSVFAGILLSSLFVAIITEEYYLAGIPAFLLLVYVSLVDFRAVYFLLLICVPLSTEIYLPNGFGTDLPTEPLIVGLMLIYFLFVLMKGKELNSHFFRHPISLLLLLHFFWIIIATVTSDLVFVSIKFSLAKLWYIVTFFYLTGYLVKTEKDIKIFFWSIFIPLMFTVLVTLVRHSTYGFSFKDVHEVLHPFQRNHVNYAATLALFFPLVWFATNWYPIRSRKWWILVGAMGVLFIAIYLSFTRAAYISLAIALGTYYIFQFRLIRHALVVAGIAAIIGAAYMIQNNTYLEYAPNYERTITHTEFDNLVEATYKLEDISTMERVYRWVAGLNMTQDQFIFGFGPGNFVNFYKSYTVTSFQTYVSDNEDKSGIHSYFLMTLVEQGILGLLIFVLLTAYVLIKGEVIYHQTTDPARKRLVMMVLLCLIVIDAFLIINDLIETDKIGSFFFISMAILINMDLANKADLKKAKALSS